MRRTLVIILKVPRVGCVKTRLAKDLGAVPATRIYRALCARLLRRVGMDARWRTVLSIAPDELAFTAGRGPAAWPGGIVRIPQGGGNLGDRIERALRAAPPGPVVLIGSDSPDVTAAHIEKAFRALGAHDAVFGPAEDGGFWLIGLSRRRFPDGIFEGVRWSTEHTLEDVLQNLRPRYSVALIDALMDIDTGQDWLRWKGRKR